MSNMVVQTNMLAFNAHRNMGITGNAQARASARLSSGFRINTAADDAAGLAISETMRAQIRSIDQSSRNAQDGISLFQVAEGALGTISDMVTRIRELTVQAANDTYTETDREFLELEILQLLDEIEATADRVEFNTMNLLGGTPGAGGAFPNAAHLQIGPNNGNGATIEFNGSLGGDWGTVVDVMTHVHAVIDAAIWDPAMTGVAIEATLADIDEAHGNIAAIRAELGAWMNRLEFTIENLDINSENLAAANSRIRDADMAQEMMRFTQTNVLQQAAISMLAQANQQPQNLLQLLR